MPKNSASLGSSSKNDTSQHSIDCMSIAPKMDRFPILNYWDHAVRRPYDLCRTVVPPSSPSHRTGTWRFMSIEILHNAPKGHNIQDDIESTFWVFYHTALHFFKVKRHDSPLRQPRIDIFDECETSTDAMGQIVYWGGALKLDAMMDRKMQDASFDSEPLTAALHKFADSLGGYHSFRCLSIHTLDISEKWREVIEKGIAVESLIKIFDDIFERKDLAWPEYDDAVEDQYKREPAWDWHDKRLAITRDGSVSHSCKSPSNVEPPSQPTQPNNAADPSTPASPPASISVRRVTRSVNRNKATNALTPATSSRYIPRAVSPSKRRMGDGDAKVGENGSGGRAKRSRQLKTKKIISRASAEQTRYDMRPRGKPT
ncbi:hypothetical protein BC629DRAFT_1481071 [Irpex lacteus]|nr:hypothetical protein BC629DRAFT_1481071 [Irpex lacteus]